MKQSFRNFSLFILILAVTFLGIEFRLSKVKNSYVLKRVCLEDNISRINLVVLGSSQVYYGIDPKILSEYSCNLANSNQDFYYDNQIALKYIDKMPNLKTVVIGVSYFSFEFDLTNTEEYWRKYFYQRFWQIYPRKQSNFDIRNYSLIAAYSPQTARKIIIPLFNINLIDNVTRSGWYTGQKNNISSYKDVGFNDAHAHTDYMRSDLVSINKMLLEDTITNLQARYIQVILVTPPVSDAYFTAVDPKKYQLMQNTVLEITQKYQLQYLNYFQDERFNNNDFTDGSNHLNEQNAMKFSYILKGDIK